MRTNTESEVLELEISDLSRGGAGVSRQTTGPHAGRVVFVPLTAPGDKVRVRVVREDKHYAQGELVEILQPSPLRQVPPCPVFGRCGGCQWQHLSYELQWKTKVGGVRHSLTRVQVPIPEGHGAFEEFPADKIWNYRNRIQLRGEGEKIGFFAPGTHDLIPIEDCKIARAELNERLPAIRKEGVAKSGSIGKMFKVELTVNSQGQVGEYWNSRHAAGGFTQVHDEQNLKLQRWVALALQGKGLLLDLFGGAGNLSLAIESGLSSQMSEIHIVDTGAPVQTSPSHLNTPKVPTFFHRSAVLPWLLKARKKPLWKKVADVSVILDPPREGLAKDFTEIAKAIESLGATEIVSVGCDVDTWSRDLARWQRRGWKIMRCAVVDLFPQTPHVEAVALLRL